MDFELIETLKAFSTQLVQAVSRASNAADGEKCQCHSLFGEIFSSFNEAMEKIYLVNIPKNDVPLSNDRCEITKNDHFHSTQTVEMRASDSIDVPKSDEYLESLEFLLQFDDCVNNVIDELTPSCADSQFEAEDDNQVVDSSNNVELKIIEPTIGEEEIEAGANIECLASTKKPKWSSPLKRKAKSRDEREIYLKRRFSTSHSVSRNSSRSDGVKAETSTGSKDANDSKELKRAQAIKKRHSSISCTPFIEELIVDRKNTNKQLYWTNNLFRTLCIFCEKEEKHLVTHYVREHPEHEVPTARPSPKMAFNMRGQYKRFERSGKYITGFCYLCEEERLMSKYLWEIHFLGHTGEKQFNCETCGAHLNAKSHHKHCDDQPVNVFHKNSIDGSLIAHMCKDCNYIQINRHRMIKHQTEEHGNSGADDFYEKVSLIPNLSPIANEMEYSYIDDETCFKCTVCNEKCGNHQEFEEHFDTMHAESKRYTCVCGEVLTIDDCNMSGSFIVVHLLKHGTDLYTCMSCQNDPNKAIFKTGFFYLADIQNHLLNHHPNSEFHFKHAHRKDNKQVIFSEHMAKTMKCKTCKLQFQGTLGDAELHFKKKHPRRHRFGSTNDC